MPTYLLEIGTEELPADQVSEAQERLKSLLSEALTQANVGFARVKTMGTPRRLACLIEEIDPVQRTTRKKVKGPPVKSSFDAQGNPLPSASGFAQKQGVAVTDLLRETTGDVEYLVADLTISGKPVESILSEVVPQTILRLSGDRLMRWGACDLKFSRPIRWIVSILDDKEVHIELEEIKSGRETFGNRVLSPGKFKIAHPQEYVAKLKDARVLVDPQERRAFIEKQVVDAADKLSGVPRRLTGSLLDEVVNILEWPYAIVGEFAPEYLELPDTLIETIMVHHQRYFPVESKGTNGDKKLLPYFITVANNDRKEAEATIKQGNERVIRARLADGKFFFFDDQKVKLADRRESLDQLTFQEGLGSYLKKTDRLLKAGRALSKSLNLEAKHSICLERALELCKLDLVCNLVRELPELQGYVGSWYARREGEPPEVVAAISSHYAPRFTEDQLPADQVGRFAAALDKLDSLVALFALGRRPSGSSDPYALRRLAQGIVDIVMDGLSEYKIDLLNLMTLLIEEVKPLLARKKGFDPEKAYLDLADFLLQRLKVKLQQKGYRREVIDAVCVSVDTLRDLPDAAKRCLSLSKLLESDPSMKLVRAGVRIGNILRSDSPQEINPEIFDNDHEKKLWQKFSKEMDSAWGAKIQSGSFDYLAMLNQLSELAPEIDAFFENVMVNDPDTKKRDNRHGILSRINRYFMAVADFSKLQTILP